MCTQLRSLVLVASLIAFMAAMPGCCVDPVDGSKYFCLGEMSVAEEIALGDSYAPNILAMYDGAYHDPDAYQYLNGLILEMADHSVRADDFQWQFTILNSSTPNAFAVPGGYIYITRGLLAALETEGQFISVMGHELGHVEHRHSHRQMAKQQLGGVIDKAESSAAGGGEDDMHLATTASAFGTQLVLLKYGRDQELQSDQRGVYYAATMGYDPEEAVKTFEYFQRLEEESGGSDFEWLRTHPLNQRRIQDIEEIIRIEHTELMGRPESSFRPLDRKDHHFQQIVAGFREIQPTYAKYDAAMADLNAAAAQASDDGAATERDKNIRAALNTFRQCHQTLPDEPLFQTAIGMAHYYLREFAPAKEELLQAIALDDASGSGTRLFMPHYFLGLTHLEQQAASEAIVELSVASELFPLNPAPPFYLGRAYESLGRTQDALRSYESVLALEGDPNGPLSTEAKQRIEVLGGGAIEKPKGAGTSA